MKSTLEMGKIDDKTNEMRKTKAPWSISEDSIAFMRDFISKLDKPRVLEIGTYHGYSAMNFSKAAKEVVTIEIDMEAFEIAKKNLAIAKNVTCFLGDAINLIPTFGKFDVIFLDGAKKQYIDYLKKSIEALNYSGVIFADNTISHKNELKEFFNYLKSSGLIWKELNLGRGLVMITRSKLTEILINNHLLKFAAGEKSGKKAGT